MRSLAEVLCCKLASMSAEGLFSTYRPVTHSKERSDGEATEIHRFKA